MFIFISISTRYYCIWFAVCIFLLCFFYVLHIKVDSRLVCLRFALRLNVESFRSLYGQLLLQPLSLLLLLLLRYVANNSSNRRKTRTDSCVCVCVFTFFFFVWKTSFFVALRECMNFTKSLPLWRRCAFLNRINFIVLFLSFYSVLLLRLKT